MTRMMNMMSTECSHDAHGQKVCLGDLVYTNHRGCRGSYAGLYSARVIGFTPCKVNKKLKWVNPIDSNETVLKEPGTIIKVQESD